MQLQVPVYRYQRTLRDGCWTQAGLLVPESTTPARRLGWRAPGCALSAASGLVWWPSRNRKSRRRTFRRQERAALAAGSPTTRIQPEPAAALVAIGLVFLAATCLNKILFRVTLIPMNDSTHLLGVTTNLVYLVYFWVSCRFSAGKGALQQEAWDFSLRGRGKWLLLGSGLTQALAFTIIPLFARQLPGSSVTVLGQSMLPFSMLLSAVFLGRRYDWLQCAGVAVVVFGIAVCIYPQAMAEAFSTSASAATAPFALSAAGLLAGYVFNGTSFVFKEAAVLRYEEATAKRLNGDVVNFLTSLWQGVTLWLLWPFNFAFLTPLTLGEYFSHAWAVVQQTQYSSLILAYWLLNVFYVSTTLKAITCLSSVVVLLLSTLAVPLVALLFCLPLPMIGAAPFSWHALAGVFVIFAGMLVYNHKQLRFRKTP